MEPMECSVGMVTPNIANGKAYHTQTVPLPAMQKIYGKIGTQTEHLTTL